MSEIAQSTNAPVSMETGFLNRKWKLILFILWETRIRVETRRHS